MAYYREVVSDGRSTQRKISDLATQIYLAGLNGGNQFTVEACFDTAEKFIIGKTELEAVYIDNIKSWEACTDKERTEVETAELLLNLLDKLGYEKVVEAYRKVNKL